MNKLNTESLENMFSKISELFPGLFDPKDYFNARSIQKHIKECRKTYETLNKRLVEIQSGIDGKIKYTPVVSGNVEELAERKAIPSEQKGLVYLLEEKTDLRNLAIKNMLDCDEKLDQYSKQLHFVDYTIKNKIDEYHLKPRTSLVDEPKFPKATSPDNTSIKDFGGFDNTLYSRDDSLYHMPRMKDLDSIIDKNTSKNNKGIDMDYLRNKKSQEALELKSKIFKELYNEIDEVMIDELKPLLEERHLLKNTIRGHEDLLSDYCRQIRLNDELVKMYDQTINMRRHTLDAVKKTMIEVETTLEKLEGTRIEYNSDQISKKYLKTAENWLKKHNNSIEGILPE